MQCAACGSRDCLREYVEYPYPFCTKKWFDYATWRHALDTCGASWFGDRFGLNFDQWNKICKRDEKPNIRSIKQLPQRMMLRSDIFQLIVFLSLTTKVTALLIPTATIQHQTSCPKCWYTTYQRSNQSRRRFHLYLQNGSDESHDDLKVEGSSSIWNPKLRKIMGGVAAFGALETMYLTYSDLNVPGEEGLQNELLFCSSSSDS